ncbi:MAG: hypothetical protein QOH57_4673 [Mycobacterium sp.]|nr:hypothetical protein [Mycobacterium sp.]
MRAFGTRAIDSGMVTVFPASEAEAAQIIRKTLESRGLTGQALADDTRCLVEQLFHQQGKTINGLYDPIMKMIFLRGSTRAEGAVSVLVHETTHLGQDALNTMMMGPFHSEMEALKAQFLNLLPYDKIPPDYLWSLRSTD